ncbi:AAA family ATPase [Schlesneria paludicola]|uniref:AAA family ATPase n=1 Tax=Schlesneria paludicola TaxID=360056 RepID=UPI00029B3719|nr:AAA family ATPase [Schlesneria paludicola]
MAGWTSLKAIRNLSREWRGEPEGFAFSTLEAAMSALGQPTSRWSGYSGTGARVTEVFIFQRPDGTRNVRHVSRHEGRWYLDWPKPPYLLFERESIRRAERVVVCDDEEAASLAQKWGLGAGTTSLGGLPWIARTDWAPLADKEVVILPRRCPDGACYGALVAQRALDVGARSVKVVEIPDRVDGENFADWLNRTLDDTQQQQRIDELLELIAATAQCLKCPVSEILRSHNRVRCLSDVEPADLTWVMDELIPAASLTLITGEPGSGKSLAILDIVARVTRGDALVNVPPAVDSPGGDESLARQSDRVSSKRKATNGPQEVVPARSINPRSSSGTVLLCVPEGALERSVHRTLAARGADLRQIYGLSLPMDLSKAISVDGGSTETQRVASDRCAWLLEQELIRLHDAGTPCRLVVIDPFFISTRSTTDDVAATLFVDRLVEFANRYGAAVVLVSAANPLPHRTSRRRLNRGDEVLLSKVASAWTIENHRTTGRWCGLIPVKTNFCESPSALEFLIEDDRVEWRYHDYPPNDSLRSSHLKWRPHASELDQAIDWLQTTLAQARMRSVEVKEEGKQMGFSEITLRRAFRALNGFAKKEKGSGQWYWQLAEYDYGRMLPVRKGH